MGVVPKCHFAADLEVTVLASARIRPDDDVRSIRKRPLRLGGVRRRWRELEAFRPQLRTRAKRREAERGRYDGAASVVFGRLPGPPVLVA